VQADALAETALDDQFVEGFNAVRLEVDCDELAGGRDERGQRHAAAGSNPQLNEVLIPEAPNDLEVLLDHDAVLADRKEPTLRIVVSAMKLDLADVEARTPRFERPRLGGVALLGIVRRIDPGEPFATHCPQVAS
jgi:hypothetical protein